MRSGGGWIRTVDEESESVVVPLRLDFLEQSLESTPRRDAADALLDLYPRPDIYPNNGFVCCFLIYLIYPNNGFDCCLYKQQRSTNTTQSQALTSCQSVPVLSGMGTWMGSVRLSTALYIIVDTHFTVIGLLDLKYRFIPRPFNLEGVGVRELGSSEAESVEECYLDCHTRIILPVLNAP